MHAGFCVWLLVAGLVMWQPRCQDGVRGVVESAFAALDEVYVLRHGTKEAVKLKTNQITFLGDWSDSVACLQLVAGYEQQ